MVPRRGKFILDVAATALVQMWKVLVVEPATRRAYAGQILEWCVQDEGKMVAQAIRMGMDGGEDIAAGGLVVGGLLVWGAGASQRPRALV
eukprot:783118-Lingulodinium_polyedra.AAC.1